MSNQRRSPGVAAGLSFLFFGLGQIYNGQVAKGLALLFCVPLIAVLVIYALAQSLINHDTVEGLDRAAGLFLVMQVVGFLVWAFNIYDAYATAAAMHRPSSRGGRSRNGRRGSRHRRHAAGDRSQVQEVSKYAYDESAASLSPTPTTATPRSLPGATTFGATRRRTNRRRTRRR